jgi:hypothetical protein
VNRTDYRGAACADRPNACIVPVELRNLRLHVLKRLVKTVVHRAGYRIERRDPLVESDEYADSRWPGAAKAIDEFFAGRPERVQPHRKCDWKYFVRKGAA